MEGFCPNAKRLALVFTLKPTHLNAKTLPTMHCSSPALLNQALVFILTFIKTVKLLSALWGLINICC